MDSGDEWAIVDLDGCDDVEIADHVAVVAPSRACLHQDHFSSEPDCLPFLPIEATWPSLSMSREERLGLLSPSHRKFVLTHRDASVQTRALSPCQAFAAPSQRVHAGTTFPQRLRAQMPSCCCALSSRPRRSRVQVFTRDQSTQTTSANLDLDERQRFEATLSRTLELSMKLNTKSQTCEKLELQVQQLQGRLESSKRNHIEQAHCLEKAQRDYAFERTKSEISSDLTIEQLEALEDEMHDKLATLRHILRAKHHGIIAPKPETTCVVCLNQPACVRLLPCRHEVVCSLCALRVTTCPVDRCLVQDKVLTYGLDDVLNY